MKWCSLKNCNWCVSLDISEIIALTNTRSTYSAKMHIFQWINTVSDTIQMFFKHNKY